MHLKTIGFALLIGLACPAISQTKIGVVDADQVIQRSAKGKAFFDQYQVLVQQRRDEINAMVEQFRAQQKDAQAKAASLTEEKRAELQVELQRMQTDIKRKQEDAERETKLKLNDQLERFQKELAPLIRQVAQEQGLELVMNYGPNSDMIYFSDNINITNLVIQKYDAL